MPLPLFSLPLLPPSLPPLLPPSFLPSPPLKSAGQDYLAIVDKVSFPPRTNRTFATVPLLDDLSVEAVEDFLVELSLPPGETGVNFDQQQSTRVHIIDDDSELMLELQICVRATPGL